MVVYTGQMIQFMYWLIARSHTFDFNVSQTTSVICTAAWNPVVPITLL